MVPLSRQLLAIVTTSAVLAGCSASAADAGTPTAMELIVRPTTVTLRAGESAQLAAQANDGRGRPVGGAPIEYRARSNSIVRISAQGMISAAGTAGRDTIRVASGKLVRTVPVTVHAGTPSLVVVTGGAEQVATAGVGLPSAIEVTVRDAYGNTVPRTEIRFVTETGGETTPATVITDGSGIGRTLWTLGPVAGEQSMLVRADSASVRVEAVARAGAMARVREVNPTPTRPRAGDTVSIRLQAIDAHGNGASGAVFAFSVESGGGEVGPARLESNSIGLVTTQWTSGTKAGTNRLRVQAFQVRDTNFLLSVRTVAGPPTTVRLVSGSGARARPLSAISGMPVVRVTDRYGNPAGAVRVRFWTPSEKGVVAPSEVVTDDRGVAAPRTWTAGSTGDQTLLIQADGVPDTVRVTARLRSR
ncbi:MAG: hypothetical protein ABIT38_05270 [Gemmatimonadaceae bacterium]